MTGKDALQEKAAALKRSEYSPLIKELKTRTSVAKEQYQGFNNLFKPDEPVEIKEKNPEIIS